GKASQRQVKARRLVGNRNLIRESTRAEMRASSRDSRIRLSDPRAPKARRAQRPGREWPGLFRLFFLVSALGLLVAAGQTGFFQLFLVFLAHLGSFFLVELVVLVGVVFIKQFLPELALFFGRLGALLIAAIGVRRPD